MRDIQLEFMCPGCGLKGLTPEVSPYEAIGLVRGDLKLRCAACGAILSIQTTELGLRAELERLLTLKATTRVRESLTKAKERLGRCVKQGGGGQDGRAKEG